MNNYESFGVEDWVNDPDFRKWVYKGENDSFWVSILQNIPSQVENIEQARDILLMIRGEVGDVPEQELLSRKSKMLEYISQQAQVRSWWRRSWLQAAAVLLLASGIGGYYWKKFSPDPYNAVLTRSAGIAIIEVINSEKNVKLVTLPDGSSVLLKKAGRISYPERFSGDKREAVLLGEAFFEVQKNPAQPFYIYSGEMVTKVKGTSFSVKANQSDKEVQLVVKTGVVEISVSGNGSVGNPLILNPNELVTLNRGDNDLTTRHVKEPVLINLPIESQHFGFKKASVEDVFNTLEMVYGVHINFDRQVTSKCNITAALGDEPLIEKMAMICDVLDARFEMKNNAISVYSNGCGN